LETTRNLLPCRCSTTFKVEEGMQRWMDGIFLILFANFSLHSAHFFDFGPFFVVVN